MNLYFGWPIKHNKSSIVKCKEPNVGGVLRVGEEGEQPKNKGLEHKWLNRTSPLVTKRVHLDHMVLPMVMFHCATCAPTPRNTPLTATKEAEMAQPENRNTIRNKI